MRCPHWVSGCTPFAARRNWRAGVFLGAFVLAAMPLCAAEIEEARALFLSGRYQECVATAAAEFKQRSYSEQWRLMLVEGLWTVGRYTEARAVITNALAQETSSIRLRLLARDVFRSTGEVSRADDMVREIIELVLSRPWAYRDGPDLVVAGRAALLIGRDPKYVMDRIYALAKKAEGSQREVYLATGDLALEKHDFALAAKAFQEGLKKLPNDPDLHFGLSRAYAPSEPALMLASLEAALKLNSNHVASLLLLADHLIDAEDYAGAEKLLGQARAVNPWHPEAWAYRAVIAHLQNQPPNEQTARQTALKFCTNNPAVPHLIGLKLSQKYRFAEGAALQREALKFDRRFLPAKAQLAQDLLRLGDEAEGWRLAEEVHDADGYDVNALNLVTLRDTMAKYRTLTNEHFVLRMSPHEAALYGAQALKLLETARGRLSAKYGLELTQPVLIEVFADQKDFAVRTFGMPENHGFLGVCFGPVVTANSPASRPGHHFNWQAVLWHEFTHVVTLHLTRNKMPRWLSEGISVYEERQANPTWGERLNPRYREMVLGDELTPVSKLSGAFLTPRSELHLQFAYYQSSLVVQFLVERFGFGKLKAILRQLGEGAEINQVIAQHTAPMATLETEFTAYAQRIAQQMAPGLDFEKPGLKARRAEASEESWEEWAKARPTNFWVLTRQAKELVDEKKWAEARPVLEKLMSLYPGDTGPDSACALLAEAHRALGETNAERQVLAQLAARDSDALDAYQRLMELCASTGDWPSVVQSARSYLAVNPLVALPYRFLAEASEALGQLQAAINARRALLQLDQPNPAEAHFNLARLLHRMGDPTARRHVLQALEEAPRYRAALRLLLEMNSNAPPREARVSATGEAQP
ncbi:MAG: tetratricopeptide repeat protein [Verrucomicrobia bacterium]|nr:tetratricopeptide repeat protein [Verrucomicrobiota bacterium]